jgi:putative copper export protein/methionine-rich copper-binding protein CopC
VLVRWLHAVWIILIVAVFPYEGHGHANLERSIPIQNAELAESPSEIRIQFTEAFNEQLSKIKLEDHNGNIVAGSLSAEDDRWLSFSIPELAEGVYTVRWQVLSVDTHVTEGSFRFSVRSSIEQDLPSETISLDEPAIAQVEQQVDKAIELLEASPAVPQAVPPGKPEEPVEPAQNSAGHLLPGTTEEPPRDLQQEEPEQTSGAPSTVSESASPKPMALSTEPDAAEGTASIEASNDPDIHPIDDLHPQEHDHAHEGDSSHQHQSEQSLLGLHQLLRVLVVLGIIVIVGFISFRYIVLGERYANVSKMFSNRNERMLLWAVAVLIVITTGIQVWILADQLSWNGDYPVWERVRLIISSTMIGTASWLLLVLILLLIALTHYTLHRRMVWLKLFAAAGLLLFFPLTGHAYAAGAGARITIPSHIIHMLTAGIWFGGLFGLLTLTYRRNEPINWTDFDQIIRKFSIIALPTLLLTAVSGIVLTVYQLPSWSALLTSPYGRLVVMKSVLLLSIFGIAAVHRYVLIPRMQQNGGILASFNRAIRFEVFIAVIIVVLAGLLSTTALPAKAMSMESVYWHEMGDGAHLSFRMNDSLTAYQQYRVDVWLPTDIGSPDEVLVTVMLNNEEEKLEASIPLVLQSAGPDPFGFEGFDKFTYTATGDYMEQVGVWTVKISIIQENQRIFDYMKDIIISKAPTQ